MTTRIPTDPTTAETLADLLHQLGDVPLERVRLRPAPGTATEKDVVAALEAIDKRLFELVDGALVEKAMGTKEGLLAALILRWLFKFLDEHDLGQVLGADGAVRLMPGLIRIPDVSFISSGRLPQGIPDTPVAGLVPDLAVEVLSPSNTRGEMRRKLRDYFLAGVRLVWLIDRKTETAEAYQAPDRKKRVGKTGALDGEDVLPGFKLPLPELFARANRKPPAPRPAKTRRNGEGQS